MIRNKVLSLAILAVVVAAPVQTVFASATPERVMKVSYSKDKGIKFVVRNASDTSIDLRVGDQTMTVAAGKSLELQLPAGTRVVTATATPHTPAGTLLMEVSTAFKGTTVSIT